MIVFDFDKTLYRKDSLTVFHFFMLRRHPALALWLPLQAAVAILWYVRLISTSRFKSLYFIFLRGFTETEIIDAADQFWAREFPAEFHPLLLEMIAEQPQDIVVVTASAELYIRPLLQRLGITNLIGTRLRLSGKRWQLDGKNCKGREKIERLEAEFGAKMQIEAAYSDSYVDQPLFDRATHAYLVTPAAIQKLK